MDCKILSSFLSQLSVSDWTQLGGVVLDFVGILVAIFSLKKVYKDNLKQNLFTRKLELYVEITGCIENCLRDHDKIGKWSDEAMPNIKKLKAKSYFVVGKDFYQLFSEFVDIMSFQNRHFSKDFAVYLETLKRSMRWETDHFSDISRKDIDKIRKEESEKHSNPDFENQTRQMEKDTKKQYEEEGLKPSTIDELDIRPTLRSDELEKLAKRYKKEFDK
ncbi:hypothetical protein [Streptococcus marmotae]|uniref:hypothetical protein n=1 Tax=Streptococcus marmotae TaxID=1825069 RepID=UPI00082F0351|nr:hypothetical protein [Streptococcus marmotae]